LRVAAAVEPAIEIVEARRILRDKTDLLGSYELYMQGWARVFAYTQDDLLEGIALMERAIAIAPDFGVALAGAGISHHDVYVLGWGSDPAFHRQRAMAHLERALRIGEDDANILAWVACSLPILSGNVPRAAALVERALHVNPSSANAWFVSGYIHQCRGRFAEAIADFETAQRLAPFGFNSSFARLLVGSCQGAMGEFAMAIETVEAAGHPGPWPDIYLSTYNAELGRVEPALAAMERVRLFGVRPLAELSAMTPPGSRPTLPLGALFRIEREVAKSQGLS
jgi:adenylate cyclase